MAATLLLHQYDSLLDFQYTAYRQMRVHLPVFLKQNNSNTEQSMKKYIVLIKVDRA